MRSVLVTGVGGGVGQSVVKAMQETAYGVVGVDAEELAAGLHAVARAYKGFYASDPRFIDRLVEICLREKCGVIFPGHDIELLPLSEHAHRFRAEGIVPVVSSTETIRVCDDKLATYDFLRTHGFPAPVTRSLRDVVTFDRPVVLKPRWGGARSRDTYLVRSQDDLDLYRRLVDPENCVVQEHIEGDEYTCGTVTLGDECSGVIVMRRILRAGDTYKAFVVRDLPLEATVRAIVEVLKPFGACNVQLRVRDGEPYVFEINARCSGTTAARALAGFNEPRMIAGFLLDHIAPTYEIRQMSVLRYWKELTVENARIKQLRETGFLPGDGTQL